MTPTPQSEQQPQSKQELQPESQLQPNPQPQSKPKTTLPRTGTTDSSLVLIGSVLAAMGVLLQVIKRKD